MRRSTVVFILLPVFCYCTMITPIVAVDKFRIPNENVAQYVFENLDFTTFPSSMGPSRKNGKITFEDYGFKPVKLSGNAAELKNDRAWLDV